MNGFGKEYTFKIFEYGFNCEGARHYFNAPAYVCPH